MPGLPPPSPSADALAGKSRKPNFLLPTEPNINEVILGDFRIDAWYPSFYAEDIVGRKVQRLYVCDDCFKYTTEEARYIGHCRLCEHKDKDAERIGRLIYQKGDVSIHEVDGEEHTLFAQNLSLFAKLFLDTKSVFYDVNTFLYYLLVLNDPSSVGANPKIVGFFSKEKLSWDSNNLACILVFPPWQKRGFGQILMGASYELSKWDGRLGGPEKPLSNLGHKAYISYWAATIARHILSLPVKQSTTVNAISEATYIMQEDVIATLKEMQVLEHKKKGNANALINKAKVKAWAAAHKVDMKPPVDEDAFVVGPEEEEAEEGEEEEEMEEDEDEG